MGFMRALPREGAVPPSVLTDMNSFFGCSDWKSIHTLKQNGRITPADARLRYVELYVRRLKALGYRFVLSPREVCDRGIEGRPLYQLLFASDSEAGMKIMASIFRYMTPLRPQLPML